MGKVRSGQQPTEVRPALARRMFALGAARELPGQYDPVRQVRMRTDGSPLMGGPAWEKTMTFKEKEGPDVAVGHGPGRPAAKELGIFAERTMTKARRDPGDPLPIHRETTEVREPGPRRDPAPSRGRWPSVKGPEPAFADDAATGVVAF
jgi:hypothetical protein